MWLIPYIVLCYIYVVKGVLPCASLTMEKKIPKSKVPSTYSSVIMEFNAEIPHFGWYNNLLKIILIDNLSKPSCLIYSYKNKSCKNKAKTRQYSRNSCDNSSYRFNIYCCQLYSAKTSSSALQTSATNRNAITQIQVGVWYATCRLFGYNP